MPSLIDDRLHLQLSNIVDGGWTGTWPCLTTLGPLLRPKAENKHATMLGVYINAVQEFALDQHTYNSEQEGRLLNYLLDMYSLMSDPTNLKHNAEFLRYMDMKSALETSMPLSRDIWTFFNLSNAQPLLVSS